MVHACVPAEEKKLAHSPGVPGGEGGMVGAKDPRSSESERHQDARGADAPALPSCSLSRGAFPLYSRLAIREIVSRTGAFLLCMKTFPGRGG